MEFNVRDDIEAPIEFVFDQVTNFSNFERLIMRRGGDVERVSGDDAAEVGTKWRVKFQMRGLERKVRAEITQIDAPNSMGISFDSVSANGSMLVELVALSRTRTRLIVTGKADAKTMTAKLLFQSFKFARGKADAKITARLAEFSKETEQKYRA